MSTGRPTGWAPLRHPAFRAMWTAQFASNVGGWMQTVGAQWLMLSLSGSAAYLAFIQSAASLPVLLFAIPAGALGDVISRKRLLLVSQTAMVIASVALAVLAVLDVLTPWLLLALLFLVGAGQAWTSPTWQTLQPELVPAEERPQAIALGAVNQNLARAVGPAIGGALVAATQPSVAFFVNAATFLVVILAIVRWRETRRAVAATPPEHLGSAIRASGRYVRNSPALRAVLLRAGAFIFFASALWALLPAIAHGPLGMGSGGYGLLLGAVGVGAVGGAALLPRLRARHSADRILGAGAVAVAVPTVVLAQVHVAAVAGGALVVAGVGWILALATLNSSYQGMLPGWIKARGLAFYLIVFQGGMAIGSAVIGVLAGPLGVAPVLTGAAVALGLTPLLALRWPVPHIDPDDLLPAGDAPAPHHPGPAAQHGPVRVTLRRHAVPGQEEALAAAVLDLRRMRRRTGASSWAAWSAAGQPGVVVEEFVVSSWDDHLRQLGRVTVRDRDRIDRAGAHTDPAHPTVVTHWEALPAPAGAERWGVGAAPAET
ncbi:MFS transporter [Patulibacter americanus]|uniref:MFS transporter n=1 Tax=Patulibacter americanus TaxID=588672 RepID=UPI0003B79E6B|nr:MFS transporter [Patulibacter americanus]